jgi:hypothetical protein
MHLNEDNENLNIIRFCLDYAKENANLVVTKEQIKLSGFWVTGLYLKIIGIRKQKEAFINKNVDKGLNR